jgi:hypothetical protein
MDDLPPEMLLCIFENIDYLPDLLAVRLLARRFRDTVDRYCAQIGFAIARIHFDAFDDAILAIRLQRIPFEECCHYDLNRQSYSFIPTQEFLQIVMEDRPVPEYFPAVPRKCWIEECAAVMKLYLLALAWASTTYNGTNDAGASLAGTEIVEYMRDRAPQYIEAYLRSFYRICIFGSTFGRGVFALPVLNAVEKFGTLQANISYERDGVNEHVLQEMRRFPIYQETGEDALFQGFFGWLYAQPYPGHKNLEDECKERFFSDEERNLVALLQFWKVVQQMTVRNTGKEPSNTHHVRAVSYDTHLDFAMFPEIVYRPELRISCWSEPQAIIDHWTEDLEVSSIVRLNTDPREAHEVMAFVSLGWANHTDLLEQLLQRELASKFRKSCDLSTAARYNLSNDYGLLDPIAESELRDL